jgi:hypothetical protein
MPMARSMIDTLEHEVAAFLARPAIGRRPANGQGLPVGDPAAPAPGPAPIPAPSRDVDGAVRSRWSPARLAYWFYAVAATGAVIGQTWVAVGHLPWGSGTPFWARVAVVLPFALCLELLAMALAAMADERMRLGERAYGFRAFSAAVAAVAVGIQVAGHWPNLYWSGVFGVLSCSAYLLWLLHASARRRDALRQARKLADTAPDYGLWRRLRHPVWTARAAELARQGRVDAVSGRWRPLGLYESLRAAQLVMGDERRRPAIAAAVEQVVRADQREPRMAEVAVHTLDLDRLAAELANRVDYGAWADRLAPAITAPRAPAPEPTAASAGPGTPVAGTTAPSALEAATPPVAPGPAAARPNATAAPNTTAAPNPTAAPRPTAAPNAGFGRARVPAPRGRTTADRVARLLADRPQAGVAEVAATLGVSERTVRRYWAAPDGNQAG